MIRTFEGHTPVVPVSAYVDASAIVIGDVTLGEEVSVWPLCVLRGDVNRIVVGDRSNIQDGSILHVTSASPAQPEGVALHVGRDVTVGHRAILHACRIGDACLIGMGATVLDRAELEGELIVGANALVPPGKVLKAGFLYVGSPVREQRPLTDGERDFLRQSARHYASLKERHRTGA